MILALTAHSYEDMSPREVCAIWEKEKKSFVSSKSLSYNTVSGEEADLSVSAKFTVFPFPFWFYF